jgi:hypothetical protein
MPLGIFLIPSAAQPQDRAVTMKVVEVKQGIENVSDVANVVVWLTPLDGSKRGPASEGANGQSPQLVQRNKTFEPHIASRPKQVGTNLALFKGSDEYSFRASSQKPRQICLPQAQGQRAQVITIKRKNVESVELYLVIVLARVQGIEIGNGVDSEDYGLAINDELLNPILQRRFDNPRISLRPIVTVAGE